MKALKSIVFVTAILLLLLAAGCGNAASQPTSPPSTAPTQVPPTVVLPTSTPTPAPPTPTSPPLTGIAAVIKNYVDARNAKNVDAAMAFFADDAFYTNPFGAKYTGKTDIRSIVQHDADTGTQFELSNVQVTGSKVTFHLNFVVGGNPARGYDFEAVVQGDKITSMTAH